jgi:SAM-dependent methyltransferase
MDSHSAFVRNKFEQVSKLVFPNAKILDLGCGNGEIVRFLNSPNYFCADGQKELVDSLIKNKIKAKLIDFNKDEFPFKKEKFDFILMLDILEHVVNPSKLLKDAKRQLNEKGKLIVTLPNDYHFLNKLRFIFNKHLTENPFAPYGHLHYFPIKSGENFLKDNSFKIEKKIILPPVKPKFLPQSVKNFLAQTFPQSFARDVLYVLNPVASFTSEGSNSSF